MRSTRRVQDTTMSLNNDGVLDSKPFQHTHKYSLLLHHQPQFESIHQPSTCQREYQNLQHGFLMHSQLRTALRLRHLGAFQDPTTAAGLRPQHHPLLLVAASNVSTEVLGSVPTPSSEQRGTREWQAGQRNPNTIRK